MTRTTAPRRRWWHRLWRGQRPLPHAACRVETPAAAAPAAPDEAGQQAALKAEQHLQAALCVLALQPLPDRGEPCDAALAAVTAAALQAHQWGARNLPRRPQLLPQLIQAVNDPETSARLAAAIIGQDPVLTGNLLRIANSPAFRVQERPVDSLQRAVTLIGHDGLRQVISAVLVQPVMQLQCEVFPQFSSIVWEHALLASRAASDHARLTGSGDPFAAQWLGLTQGLGAVLVMKELLQRAAEAALPIHHGTAGTVLAQWTLPVARRVALAWELPLPVHEALDTDAPASGLALSLRVARCMATASLLCRHGVIGQSQALALLERLPGTPPAVLSTLWRRVHGRSVETLADEAAASQG